MARVSRSQRPARMKKIRSFRRTASASCIARSPICIRSISPTRQIHQLTTDGTATLLNGQLDWVYPEELELHTATWWSPDSKRIAYLQFDVSHEFSYPQLDLLGERAIAEPQRYPQAGTPNAHVRLGIVSLDSDVTKWMEIGDTADALLARVAWLPDSSQVAVERMNRVQSELDLLFCDASSGAARVVLHEQSKTWINMADNLFLLKSRPEFLWTSELASGFRHIYRYSDKGEMLQQLTSGNWEVRSIAAVDETRQRVLFTSSEQGPLENQLYAVGFDGGARSRLTKEDGVHGIHANNDGSLLRRCLLEFQASAGNSIAECRWRTGCRAGPDRSQGAQDVSVSAGGDRGSESRGRHGVVWEADQTV